MYLYEEEGTGRELAVGGKQGNGTLITELSQVQMLQLKKRRGREGGLVYYGSVHNLVVVAYCNVQSFSILGFF